MQCGRPHEPCAPMGDTAPMQRSQEDLYDFPLEIGDAEVLQGEDDLSDVGPDPSAAEVLLKIHAHRQVVANKAVSSARMEEVTPRPAILEEKLPLCEIMRILSRLLGMHELKMAMQLLEDWVSSPLASAAVSISKEQLGNFLRSFVTQYGDGLSAGARGEGLQVLDAWCARDGGVSESLPSLWTTKTREMDTAHNIEDNDEKREMELPLSSRKSRFRSAPTNIDTAPCDHLDPSMMLKPRRESAQRLAQARKLEEDDPVTEFTSEVEADIMPMAKIATETSESFTPELEDQQDDFLKEGLSPDTFFPTCAPLRMRHDLSEMLGRHCQDLIRRQRPSFCSTRSRDSFHSNQEIQKLVEEHRRAEDMRKRCCHKCVIRPDSIGRVVFDLVTVVILMHDSIVLPFLLAWDPPLSTPIIAGQYFALAFWTTDIFLSFLTGYYHEGEVVMDPSKIAWHYSRGWFVLDTMVTLIDFVNIIIESLSDTAGKGHSRVIKLLKVSRMSRIMGIARILRLFPRLREFGTLSMSTTLNVVAQVLKILLGILWINHISCCIWYGIGRMEGDTGLTWLDDNTGEMTYKESPMIYQYSTAMHFSMTQMTPGSMQVFPVNSAERIYNVILLIFGLLFGSTLVGQLSTNMIQYKMARQNQTRSIEVMRQFLRENDIRQELATRVQRQIFEKIRVHTRLSTKDVGAIETLSDALRCELRVAAFSPHFLLHPLFMTWMDIDSHVVKDLCTNPDALEFMCLEPGSVLVAAHEKAVNAYLLLKGTCRYVGREEADDSELTSPCSGVSPRQMLRSLSIESNNSDWRIATASTDSITSTTTGGVQQIVNAGQWLCEVALWMDWTHKGTLDAVLACELLVVNAAAIINMLKTHRLLAPLTQAWGQAFCKHGSGEGHYLDLGQDHGAIVALLPEEPKMLIGNATMAFIEGQMLRWNKLFKLSNKQLDMSNLWAEVESGKSTIIIDGTGKLLRTTFVVVMRITRHSDKKLFVQLAKKDKGDDQFSISPALIGAKMAQGEMPRDVVQGLFKRDLFPLKGNLHITRTGWSVEQKESATLAVDTRYLRTIFHAVLVHAPDDFFRTKQYYSSNDGRSSVSTSNENAYSFDHVEACLLNNGKGKVTICGWVSQFEFNMLLRREYHDSLGAWINTWCATNSDLFAVHESEPEAKIPASF